MAVSLLRQNEGTSWVEGARCNNRKSRGAGHTCCSPLAMKPLLFVNQVKGQSHFSGQKSLLILIGEDEFPLNGLQWRCAFRQAYFSLSIHAC